MLNTNLFSSIDTMCAEGGSVFSVLGKETLVWRGLLKFTRNNEYIVRYMVLFCTYNG